jgi:hypothetical protein
LRKAWSTLAARSASWNGFFRIVLRPMTTSMARMSA